jgi:hypothetical protein
MWIYLMAQPPPPLPLPLLYLQVWTFIYSFMKEG